MPLGTATIHRERDPARSIRRRRLHDAPIVLFSIDRPQQEQRLSTGSVIAYGGADFAFNLAFSFCSLFLLYFYTDILGLSGVASGMVVMAALVWEGVSDPLFGFICGKISTRWGRYRPYLLWGAVPLAIAFLTMFVPVTLTGVGLLVYAIITHLLFRTVYTVVNIPYIALSAEMTQCSDDRGRLASARMFFAMAAGLVLSATTLPLVAWLGGGRVGFFRFALVLGIVVASVLLAAFVLTRERRDFAERAQPSLAVTVAAIMRNRLFLCLLAASLLATTGYTISSKALVYYMKYHAGSEAVMTQGLTIMLATAAATTWFWSWFARRSSKRNAWLAANAVSVICLTLLYLLAPRPGLLLWMILAGAGAGQSGFYVTFWSMLPDTVEFGELRTGVRGEGALVGGVILVQKLAMGLGIGLVGAVLSMLGYVPNREQSDAAINGILMGTTLVPIVLIGAGAAMICRYPLDQRRHRRMVELLDRRRRRRSPSD
jgi:GPH family glycoside/pentoside/hexuronide:cation symporter